LTGWVTYYRISEIFRWLPAMIPSLSERENAVEHINSICMRLFDIWCEHRSVIPLVCLMHCWPLTDSHPTSIRRLGDTLSALRKTHFEAIGTEAMQALCELADCVDAILSRAAAPQRGSRAARGLTRIRFPVEVNVADGIGVADADAHATSAQAEYAVR
jgi:hypothetical protein